MVVVVVNYHCLIYKLEWGFALLGLLSYCVY